ncbi:hypothetical protein VMCG_04965 [Cytospora schulzeri]|uniref:Uncharacterized protein n=1 Tax=Cytospora schulzeri TaxID=448051 RepID=A0A423WM95_9PEZI|nr:hypothetical protein VMCG_04965 [Valsa malicola]
MAGITIANMRKGVLLHKLILLENLCAQLLLGGWQGYNLFWSSPEYGWWLSVSATCLHISSGLHNVIAWLKIKPFLSKRSSRIFIGTIILVQPYWIVEIYATFAFFNNLRDNRLFVMTRPIETLFRDPWWVIACVKLLWTLKRTYEMTFRQVVLISPRFAVMLFAMGAGLVFALMDILSVTDVLADALPVGVNPFWKLALVFKCLTDTIILDDFKTVLDRLWQLRSEGLAGAAAPLMPGHVPSDGKRCHEHADHISLHSSQRGNGADAQFEMQPPGKARVLV